MFIVSHFANYEPSGHENFPDKEFSNYDDARNYYSQIRKEYRAKAEKCINDHPKLYSDKQMRDELWQEFSNDYLDPFLIEGFVCHVDYAYHTFQIEEL